MGQDQTIALMQRPSLIMSHFMFSVVICTHNRSGLLTDAIASLREQAYPPEAYEIIVVDNASTDDTRDVVERLKDLPGHPVRYVYEPRLGKSFACNTGAREARGDVVAYTDDDVIADSGWLEGLAEGYSFGGPDVVGVGGAIRLLWEADRPTWLPVELDGYLGDTRRLGDRMRVLDYGIGLHGGNISARRSTLIEVGGFTTGLGPTGFSNLARYDEDLEFCQRIWRHGKRLVFAPHALVHHRISPLRATRLFFLRRGYAQGASDVLMARSHSTTCSPTLLRSLAMDTLLLARDLAKTAWMRLNGRSHDAFAQLVYSASRLGRIRQELALSLRGSR
jgi:glycosyltransferase involved in cell wall biosynthesis